MLITKIKNWLLPNTCVLCGNAAKRDLDLCVACEQELPWLTHACVSCALPLSKEVSVGRQCGTCLQQNLPFSSVLALFQYQSPVDRLITGLKFHQRLVYAKLLSELLERRLAVRYQSKPMPECVIPMPLHRDRLRERGFNQAVEIARPLVKKLGIKLDMKSCQRVRATLAQTSLPAKERQYNVKNAFYVNSTLYAKHVAILDDVVTTGHTVSELARVLNNAGVEQVDIWCCARTSMLGD